MAPIFEDNEHDAATMNLHPQQNFAEPPTIISSTGSPYSKPFNSVSLEKKVTIYEEQDFSRVTTPPKEIKKKP